MTYCWYGQPHWWAMTGTSAGTSDEMMLWHGYVCQRCGAFSPLRFDGQEAT